MVGFYYPTLLEKKVQYLYWGVNCIICMYLPYWLYCTCLSRSLLCFIHLTWIGNDTLNIITLQCICVVHFASPIVFALWRTIAIIFGVFRAFIFSNLSIIDVLPTYFLVILFNFGSALTLFTCHTQYFSFLNVECSATPLCFPGTLCPD